MEQIFRDLQEEVEIYIDDTVVPRLEVPTARGTPRLKVREILGTQRKGVL